MNSNLIAVDGESFDSVINSSKVVLIDFWAEWCMPCKMFLTTLAELAEEYNGKAVIGKVNVDENPDLSEKYGVMSIPTVFVFVNGKPIERFVGSRPKPLLIKMLDKYISEA
jgi:thioredoxin 1